MWRDSAPGAAGLEGVEEEEGRDLGRKKLCAMEGDKEATPTPPSGAWTEPQGSIL